MNKLYTLLLLLNVFILSNNSFALDAPTVSATAKGPNQINLSWSGVANPGYGYKVEIQSSGDSRYSSWTDYTATLKNGFGYLPYWVTEGHYLDRSDGSGTTSSTCITPSTACGTRAQLMVFGLKYGTTYNFRVRSYGKNDAGVASYSSYSTTASATTTTPSVIRHVKQGGTGDGTSEANAWGSLGSANGVAAGTLVIVHGGTLSATTLNPSNNGTQASRIVYQADPGESVILTAPSGTMINIARSYIVVDGFTMQDPNGTSDSIVSVGGNRNSIANTTLDGPAPTYSGYTPWIAGSYNVFENNYWREYGTMDGSNGSIMNILGNYNVISNDHHEKGGHDGFVTRGDWNFVANTLFDGGWGMGFELLYSGSDRANFNLVEGCVIANVAKAGSPYVAGYKPALEISADYNVVRRNVLKLGRDHGMEINSGSQYANYNLVYNNVIYKFDQGGLWYMTGAIDHNTFANNIVYSNAENFTYGCNHTQIMLRNTRTGSVHHHNLFLAKWGGVEYPLSQVIYDESTSACRSLAQQEAVEPTLFYSNYTVTPNFINESDNEFHLKSVSGLIGIGIAITDDYWGTTGETDIGAYKYYSDSSSVVTLSSPNNLKILLQ